MTFYFGILAEIDIGVSTLALALTILFLTCFDVITRVIEYSVRNNQIYNKMLQKMYKEVQYVCLYSHCFDVLIKNNKHHIMLSFFILVCCTVNDNGVCHASDHSLHCC